MNDARQRFSVTADAYHRFRPGYPEALLDWIASTTGVPDEARVADLGCGTGISTRFLAARGWRVVGVDGNAEMLAHARAAGGAAYLRAEADRTGLADASVDLVASAQAFHWFALEPALAEIRRILAPRGWACVFWNLRAHCPFNDLYEPLLRQLSTEYAARSDVFDPRERLLAVLPAAARVELRSEERLPWDIVLGRVRSASYVAHAVAERDLFERRLRDIFERTADADGRVRWAMRTVALAWPRR